MITDPVLQWVFTGTFLALAVHPVVGVVRAVVPTAAGRRGDGWPGALHHLLHLVMCLDMAAMVWPWWAQIPIAAQLLAFSAGAVWFAVPALRAVPQLLPRRPGAIAWRDGSSPLPGLMNAAMMLAMVWMVAVMAPDAAAGGAAAGAAVPSASGHQHGSLPPTQIATGLGLSALMIAAALGYATGAVDRGAVAPQRRLHAVANTAMSAGMAAMCWLMVSS